MSEFFKPVEFKEPPSPADNRPKTKVVWDEEKLQAAFKLIKKELEKIRSGTSEFTTYAIEPSSFGFPAANQLKIFLSDPSDKLFDHFKQIARQDWGKRAGDHFAALLSAARREEPNE